MAETITIRNTDSSGFEILIDGNAVPEIQHCLVQGSLHITPGHGHSLVGFELITTHVAVEHDVRPAHVLPAV